MAPPLIAAIAKNISKPVKWAFAKRFVPHDPNKPRGEWHESRFRNVQTAFYEAGWAYDSIARFAGDDYPAYTEGCAVTVKGNKLSTKADLKKLALALAFGRAYPAPTDFALTHSLKIKIDEVNKVVTVEYTWQMGGLLSSKVLDPFSSNSVVSQKGLERIVNDRTDPVIGGDWTPFAKVAAIQKAAGVLPSSIPLIEIAQAPAESPLGRSCLPAYSEVLLTDVPAPNPFPTFDGTSRATDLTKIIAQALEMPCSPKTQPDTAQQYKVQQKPSNTIKAQRVPPPQAQAGLGVAGGGGFLGIANVKVTTQPVTGTYTPGILQNQPKS